VQNQGSLDVNNVGIRTVVSRDTKAVLGELDRLFSRGTVAGLAEGELLERFVAGRDEAAFAALLARHGPMVLGVCRRVLRDEHDVEDAFQATFLVLARRAGAIHDGDLVGHWLYGVAHRVSVRARALSARRHAREPAADAAIAAAPAPSSADDARRELRAVLDEELARLPDTLRAPLVLCYLDGLTHEEAAQRLRWPVGTVRSRMARARDRLRRRLSRRGLVGDEASLIAALAARPVSPSLIDATVRASLSFSTGKPAATLTTATAAALAQGVLNAMFFAKLKILTAAALTCVVAALGVQTYAFQFGEMGGGQTSKKAIPKAENPQAALIRSIDKIQAELADSARRNAELQKQVQALRAALEVLPSVGMPGAPGQAQALRAQLEALKSAQSPAAAKEARPEDQANAKEIRQVEEKTAIPAAPQYCRISSGNALLVVSPEGDKATVYYPATKKARSLRLSEDKSTPHTVMIIEAPGIVALSMRGPKITRIAVFDENDGTWYPADLREPVDQASPIVGPGSVVYTLGRRIYAFTSAAKQWDVLEFPEGVQPTPIVGPHSITSEHDGHIYTFNNQTGKWDDLDTRAILDTPEDGGNAKPEPRSLR
jgi:RNA polymerase sigma factor (sigma-70 family)